MEMLLPRNYLEIDNEEMMYLDGGGVCRGMSAWGEISNMAWKSFGLYKSAAILAAKAGAYTATGWGTVIAVFKALGATASFISALWETTMLLSAMLYTMQSGGFRNTSSGFLIWSWSNVKPL